MKVITSIDWKPLDFRYRTRCPCCRFQFDHQLYLHELRDYSELSTNRTIICPHCGNMYALLEEDYKALEREFKEYQKKCNSCEETTDSETKE